MLTNKKIWVLIIVLSLFFVSCSSKENINSNTNTKTISIYWKKLNSFWTEVLQKNNTDNVISDTKSNELPLKPNIIK